MRLLSGLLLLAISVAAAGCGVQADSDASGGKRDCDTISKLADVQSELRGIDVGILNDRPEEITLDALPPLVEHYREASASYRELEQRSRAELKRLEADPNSDPDLVETWQMMADSLRFRREGIEFFADAFANPASVASAATQERGRRYEQEQEEINKRLEQRLIDTFAVRGFERRDDGQFVLDCP